MGNSWGQFNKGEKKKSSKQAESPYEAKKNYTPEIELEGLKIDFRVKII